jgi:uncharacterized protein YjbJ (UPF0337 family)
MRREREPMSTKDRAFNKVQNVKGKGKESIGSAVGNKDLEEEGMLDQTKAGTRDAGEDVKDAAAHLKDAILGQ